jgi:hypothetical protein
MWVKVVELRAGGRRPWRSTVHTSGVSTSVECEEATNGIEEVLELFWGDIFGVVDREEQVVRKVHPLVNPFSFQVAEHLGRMRNPHVQTAAAEMNRAILDRGVIHSKANVRKGSDQIRLQAGNLIAVFEKPGPPLESHGVRRTIPASSIRANSVRFVLTLTELDLPDAGAFPSCESFAAHRKIARIVWVKNQHKRRQALRGDTS